MLEKIVDWLERACDSNWKIVSAFLIPMFMFSGIGYLMYGETGRKVGASVFWALCVYCGYIYHKRKHPEKKIERNFFSLIWIAFCISAIWWHEDY